MDTTIYFKKIDNVRGQIICEDYNFVCDLREKFSFFADGYRFHPSFKNKCWDGKVRLLDTKGFINLGLWRDVQDFCIAQGRHFKLDPAIRVYSLPKERLQGFIERLNVHTGGESITPYYYQTDAAHHALEAQRCILISPTSSGKSLIQYILLMMYQKIVPEHLKILIIVPNIGLTKQMFGDFEDYASEIEWDADKKLHVISGGVKKDSDKRIFISTYQSISKQPKEWYEQFGAVMVDEVHTATAKSIMGILDNATNAAWRVGLTGTLDECKTNEMTLRGLFGPVHTVIETHELMEKGVVAQLKIGVAVLEYPDKERKFLRSADRGKTDTNGKKQKSKATYQEEIQYLTEHEARNRLIMKMALKFKGNTIVMVNLVNHGELIYNTLKEIAPDRDVYLYTGATDGNERERIRKLMEESENAIIVGSLGVLSTGISIKRLHNMIFAHPSKSRIKVLQSVGRLLRLSKYGNDVKMYDLVDNFCIGKYENYTYLHGQKRVEFYNGQRFETTVKNINLGE